MQIKQAHFNKSSQKLSDCPKPDRHEYAFIGRSNVGKSSLINMLTNKKNLAKTSGVPGKTQLINHFDIDNKWFLVDLPGYGWAKVSKTEKGKWGKFIEDYLLHRENLICTFLLIDVRHEPQKIDLEFIEWLAENERPFCLIFTKTDKLSKNKVTSAISHYKKVLKTTWEELPINFSSSSLSKEGKEEILAYISQLNDTVSLHL